MELDSRQEVCQWVTFGEGPHVPVNLGLLSRLEQGAEEWLSPKKAL